MIIMYYGLLHYVIELLGYDTDNHNIYGVNIIISYVKIRVFKNIAL